MSGAALVWLYGVVERVQRYWELNELLYLDMSCDY